MFSVTEVHVYVDVHNDKVDVTHHNFTRGRPLYKTYSADEDPVNMAKAVEDYLRTEGFYDSDYHEVHVYVRNMERGDINKHPYNRVEPRVIEVRDAFLDNKKVFKKAESLRKSHSEDLGDGPVTVH